MNTHRFMILTIALTVLALVSFQPPATANEKSNAPRVQNFDRTIDYYGEARYNEYGNLVASDEKIAYRSSTTFSSEEVVKEATRVLNQGSGTSAPSMIQDAAAVAIFPSATSQSVARGYIPGVLIAREGGEWGNPLFASISSGCMVGQDGSMEPRDLVLVFNNRDDVEKLINDSEFTLGSDTAIGMSPSEGRTDGIVHSTDDFSLPGSIMKIETDQTLAYYNLSHGEAGALGYYGGDSDALYDDVVEGSRFIKRQPSSADQLKQAVRDFVSSAG